MLCPFSDILFITIRCNRLMIYAFGTAMYTEKLSLFFKFFAVSSNRRLRHVHHSGKVPCIGNSILIYNLYYFLKSFTGNHFSSPNYKIFRISHSIRELFKKSWKLNYLFKSNTTGTERYPTPIRSIPMSINWRKCSLVRMHQLPLLYHTLPQFQSVLL